MSGVVETIAFGHNRVVSGGTRNKISLSRPWQTPLGKLIKPETCPFCTKPQEEIFLPGMPNGWRLLPNIFTPHENHKLIVPDVCWNADMLQALGGAKSIQSVFEIAGKAVFGEKQEVVLFTHIGFAAGQNLGHHHWHLLKPRTSRNLEKINLRDERVVAHTETLIVFADGARAGECLIVPNGNKAIFTEILEKLADFLENFVGFCNEKWKSVDLGMPPDFILTVRISKNGRFRYADYCPILTMWGGYEYVLACREKAHFTLPWTHEFTAWHLNQNAQN